MKGNQFPPFMNINNSIDREGKKKRSFHLNYNYTC